jgi:hypothetical protein
LLQSVLLGAYASLTVADTVPLSPRETAPLNGNRISNGRYRLDALPAPG